MLSWQITLIALSLLSGFVSLWIAGLSAQRRVRGAAELRLLMGVIAGWSFIYAFMLTASDEALLTALQRLRYVIASCVGMAALLLALRLTESEQRIKNRGLIALGLPVGISCILAIFNPDGIFYTPQIITSPLGFETIRAEAGPALPLFYLVTYGYSIAAGVLLAWWAWQSNEQRHPIKLTWGVVIALAVMLIVNLTVGGRLSVDVIPVTASVISCVMGVGLLRLHVFDLLAVASDRAILNMPDGVLIVDREGRIRTVNIAFERLSGLSAEDIEGQPVAQALADLNPSVDGEMVWHERLVSISTSPVLDRRRRVQGQLWIVRDVTDQRYMERRRYESDSRYETLFNRASEAMFIIDREERIIEVNKTAAALVERSVDSLLNTRLNQLYSTRRADDKTDTSSRFEAVIQRATGGELTVEISLAAISSGTDGHVLAIARDITERKRAESDLAHNLEQLKKLRQISDEISETLSVDSVLTMAIDVSLRMCAADGGFIVLLGDDRHIMAVQAIGHYNQPGRFGISLNDPITARVLNTGKALMILASDPDDADINGIPKSRGRITVPLISRERLIGLLNIETRKAERFTDETFAFTQIIGDRIAMAMDNARLYRQAQSQIDELKELYEKVSRLESLKGDMISIAAHDIRNPLTVLLGYLTLMDEESASFDEYHRDNIRRMLLAARQINGMTEQILSIERIERMAQEEASETFDLVHQAQEVVQEFVWQAEEKGQTLSFNAPKRGAIVYGDVVQIYEAMRNLIGNALKYTGEGGAINVNLSMEASGHVLFAVVDNGYGVPEDQQDLLFMPFSRIKTEETEQIDGKGLGLSLVKKIIDRHNGQIIFESEYGKGSTFGFLLPPHETSKQSGTSGGKSQRRAARSSSSS